MTPRSRFREVMRYGRPDRVPWLEEGLRDDVLARWREQGVPPGADPAELFPFDRRERLELDLSPHLTRQGAIHNLDPARLADALDPADPARLPSGWDERVRAWRDREHILELPIHRGLFLTMGVGGWNDLEELSYALADDPLRVRQAMDVHARFAAALADRVLREVQVDFASFSEPIGGNHGPLVSPALYREVILTGYRLVVETLRRHGVDTIVFATYGNARALLPDVLDAGFNCLWAMETETAAMDYRDLRRQFGASLRLIGGIDLDCLTQGQAAIETEIRAKVPPLLAQGGYIPLADGRVRVNIPLEGYRHYRRLLQRVTQTP